MQVLLPVLGITSGIIGLVAYPPYIRDMFRRTTRPERASWLIWTVLSGISLGSQLAAGAKWSIIMTLANTLGVTVIFLLSLKFGEGGLRRHDIISLLIAALGLLLWLVTDKPLVALLIVVIVDAAGAWLTVYKAYRDPSSETLATWWIDCASNALGLLAVGSLNFSLVLYPAYLLVANGGVVVAIYLARHKTRRAVLAAQHR